MKAEDENCSYQFDAESFSAEEQWMCWECGDKYPVSQPPTKIVNDSKDPYGSKGITGSFCSNCSKGAESFSAESFASEGPYECPQCREYGDYDPGEAPAAEEECDSCGDSLCINCYTYDGGLCMRPNCADQT